MIYMSVSFGELSDACIGWRCRKDLVDMIAVRQRVCLVSSYSTLFVLLRVMELFGSDTGGVFSSVDYMVMARPEQVS